MGTFADEQVLYNNNPSPTTAVGLAQMRYNQTAIRELPGASAPVIVAIADGAIAPTSAFVRVDTEGQAGGDDLEIISPVLSDTDSLHDGMILYLQAADQDRVVTVRSTASANGIQTYDGQDVVLDTTTWLVLQLRRGTWYEMRDLFSKTLNSAVERTSGSLVPVGSIIWSANATVPAGYLLCNGASVGRDTYPELFAAIGTTYGEGDGSTTFNLPDLIGRFLEGSSTAGTVKAAGLPAMTGSVVVGSFAISGDAPEAFASPSGCLATSNLTGAHRSLQPTAEAVYSKTWSGAVLHVDASRSSAIYGNSTTVQPPSVTALPCIKAFSAVIGDATVVAAELVDDIMARTDPAQAARAAMPSGQYIDLTLPAHGGSVTAPADGYIHLNKWSSTAGQYCQLNNATAHFSTSAVTSRTVGDSIELYIPVTKNDVVKVGYNAAGQTVAFRFIYANGSAPTNP